MTRIQSERTRRIMELLAEGNLTRGRITQIAEEVGCTRQYVAEVAARKEKPPVQFKADLLRALRESKSWTREALAEKMGVATSEVSRWESGEHTPRPVRIKKLARLFGIQPQEFMILEVVSQ